MKSIHNTLEIMAKYSSLFKVEGTLGEVTFFKSEDGYQMLTKGGVSKSRIAKDPAFARTRENNQEFANAATGGKMLRQAIIDLLADAKDSKLASRLTKQMSIVKNADLVSPRGMRNVAEGILTADGKNALKGFDFNRHAILSAVLLNDYVLNPVTGEITMVGLIPADRLHFPEGATHVEFTSGYLNLELATDIKDLQLSNVVNLPINGTATTVTLTPLGIPVGAGQQFYFLKVAFFQEINAVQYPLKNGGIQRAKIVGSSRLNEMSKKKSGLPSPLFKFIMLMLIHYINYVLCCHKIFSKL
ncbi:MAG: hypothetical protein ACSHXF_13345 [Aquaticitalea sp.]